MQPEGYAKKNEAGGENLAKENEQKRKESSTWTTEELPTENLQHRVPKAQDAEKPGRRSEKTVSITTD